MERFMIDFNQWSHFRNYFNYGVSNLDDIVYSFLESTYDKLLQQTTPRNMLNTKQIMLNYQVELLKAK